MTVAIKKLPAIARRRWGIGMARPGRKRKSKAYDPNRANRPTKEDQDDRVRTSRQPHRRAIARAMRKNHVPELEVQKAMGGEEAESPIGRLWLAGQLQLAGDANEGPARDRYDAAGMYARVVGDYRSVIEAPRDVAGSGRGYACDPLGCRIYPDDCRCARRRARYDQAFEILARLGRRALMAVNRVAIHREPIGEEDLVYLVSGLEQLRRHFGLTARRPGKHHRNAN